MGNIKIKRGVFDTQLELQHAGVRAGFPSPAEDYIHDTLDFNRDYIRHPEASFYGDVEGDSMKDAGIFDGDRVIIDKAVEAHNGSIVVAFWNGEFTMKYLDLTHKKDGYIELRPANPDYPVFKVEAGDDFEVSYNIFVVFCSGREGRKNPCRYRIKTIDVLCELVHLVAEELLRACISVFHIIHLPFPVVWLSPFYSVISPWIRGFSLYELSP